MAYPRQPFCKVSVALEVEPRPDACDAALGELVDQRLQRFRRPQGRRRVDFKTLVLEISDIPMGRTPDFHIAIKRFVPTIKPFELMDFDAKSSSGRRLRRGLRLWLRYRHHGPIWG